MGPGSGSWGRESERDGEGPRTWVGPYSGSNVERGEVNFFFCFCESVWVSINDVRGKPGVLYGSLFRRPLS